LFQKIANEGHYKKIGGSRQGIYVCSPNGTLLTSINSLDPDIVLETILEGLKKWNALPQENKKLPKNFSPFTAHRWEDSYPIEGLVLKGAKADLLSDPPIDTLRGNRWNMDYIWFSKEESKLWIPKSKIIGSIQECPEILKERLFRFHLVDNVRGQTLPFAPEEIIKANLNVQLKEIEKSTIKFKILGNSKAIARGPWKLGENDWTPKHELNHSMNTDILGNAIYDMINEKFVHFEIVIIGNWEGKTQNNGRKAGPESGRIGIIYNLSKNDSTNKIAPAFIDLYNADWVKKPKK